MNTSAPRSASSVEPFRCDRLVIAAMRSLIGFRPSRPSWMRPLLSDSAMSPMPPSISILETAMPDAPAPATTARSSERGLPTKRAAFFSAASATIAVPCWSSWKTGMSRAARSRSSISKQRGALMSSKLMPPKLGAIRITVSTISSTPVQFSAIGTESTSANSLNSRDLPSMTGMDAAGPMSPRPSTAVPSVTTATTLASRCSRRPARGCRRWRCTRGRRRACRPARGRPCCGLGWSTASPACRRGAAGRPDRPRVKAVRW